MFYAPWTHIGSSPPWCLDEQTGENEALSFSRCRASWVPSPSSAVPSLRDSRLRRLWMTAPSLRRLILISSHISKGHDQAKVFGAST